MKKVKKTAKTNGESIIGAIPFENAQEAWFWFIAAQQARNDGAKFLSGLGLYQRPCEPMDILNILNRLYRTRRLTMDHILVLRHYGRRQLSPDSSRVKERRAHYLWTEAFERLSPVFIRKGIITAEDNGFFGHSIAPCLRHSLPSSQVRT